MKKDGNFRHMDRQAVEVINRVTNSGMEYPEGKRINVCGAIEAIKREGIAEGEVKGIIKTYRRFNDKKDGLLEFVLESCIDLDEKQANEYIEQYWEE